MRYLRLLTAAVIIPVFMSGCASLGIDEGKLSWCVVGGAAAGAAAGVAADGEAGGAVIGALVGAVLGHVLCQTEPMEKEMMAKDSDGDGVDDDKDKCPNTPKAARGAIDANGCPTSTDGDNVADYLDRCPGTPAGVGTDKWGCPADSDNDGVYDYEDKCPNTPKGTDVDDTGCPFEGDKIAIITNVNFDFDRANIRSDAAAKLGRVISILKENPDIKVRIVGHTDSTGTKDYNQGLSERRAVSVRRHLQDKGISITRLSVRGGGEAEPLVSNKTRAGRAVNRRVEFEVR